MEADKGTICVTGGTGFLASWMIKRLLEDGYSVHTTMRPDPEHKRDISFLTALPGASEELRIFQADLSNPETFNEAIKGCIGVFHVATPVDFEDKEPEEVVTRRSIDGALSILKACLEAKTVKRVAYTSSASAVVYSGKDVDAIDESFWTDVDFVRSLKPFGASYTISKTSTEKAVLEFAEQHGLDLVTLIPSFIVGPFICPKLHGSVRAALAMVFGDSFWHFNIKRMNMVHIDDVARAHTFLFEHPNPKGRYIRSSDVLTLEEIHQFLATKFPDLPIPTLESLKDVKGYKSPRLSTKKLQDYGFKYMYGIDEMYDGAIQSCKGRGYL